MLRLLFFHKCNIILIIQKMYYEKQFNITVTI